MIEFKGQQDVARNLLAIADQLPARAAGALFRRAEAIMADSKENYVPVDVGVLQSSGHVELPVIDGRDITVTMGFGGSASAYALAIHEHLSEHSPRSWRVAEQTGAGVHFSKGGPKYLERPLMAAERTFLDDIAGDLGL